MQYSRLYLFDADLCYLSLVSVCMEFNLYKISNTNFAQHTLYKSKLLAIKALYEAVSASMCICTQRSSTHQLKVRRIERVHLIPIKQNNIIIAYMYWFSTAQCL